MALLRGCFGAILWLTFLLFRECPFLKAVRELALLNDFSLSRNRKLVVLTDSSSGTYAGSGCCGFSGVIGSSFSSTKSTMLRPNEIPARAPSRKLFAHPSTSNYNMFDNRRSSVIRVRVQPSRVFIFVPSTYSHSGPLNINSAFVVETVPKSIGWTSIHFQ